MSNTEQQGQQGQGQKPYQPGKTEGERPAQPGKDKGGTQRTADNTGGAGGTGGSSGSQQPKPR